MLDVEDLLSVPGFDKLTPGNQQKVRAFFFRKFVAPRAYYRRAAPDEKNQIARETIFGPEEPRAKPTLPERFLARGHEALSLGFRPAEELPPPETTGEALAEQAGGFAGAAAPFFLFAQAGFPAGAALATKMAGPASRFAAPTLARTVGEEALKFGLTGTAEEAVKGALQQRPAAETARVMAERFPGEAAFGGAFGALTPRVLPGILEPPSPTFFREARKSFAEEEAAQPKPPPGGPTPSQPTRPSTGGLPPSLSIPAVARSASGKDIQIDFENPVEKAAYLYQQTSKPDLAPFVIDNIKGAPEDFVRAVQAKVDQAAATADRLGLSFGYVKAGEAKVGKPVSVSALNRAATTAPTQRQAASQQPPVFEPLMTKEGVKNKRRAEASLRLEDAEIKKQQIITDAQMILADANASEFSKQAAREALQEAGITVKPPKPPMGKVAAQMRAKAEREGALTIEDIEAINAEARTARQPPAMEPQLTPDINSLAKERLRMEGLSSYDADAILSGRKTSTQVVDDILGVKKTGKQIESTKLEIIEHEDGTRSAEFVGPAGDLIRPENIGTMSHVDAIELARESAIDRIETILGDLGIEIKLQLPPEVVQALQTPGTKEIRVGKQQPPTVEPLPRSLAGAKPRYNYGTQPVELTFERDVEKAAFILAQAKKSKQDAAYLSYVMKQTGLNESRARAYGQQVKDYIKSQAATGSKDVTIPEIQPLGTPPVFQPATPTPRRPKAQPDVPSLINDIRSRGGIWVSEKDWADWAPVSRQYPGLIGKLENAKAKGKIVEPADALADDLAAQGIIPEGGANGLRDALMGRKAGPKISASEQQRADLYNIATTTGDASILEAIIKETKLPEDIRLAAEKNLAEIRAFEKDAIEFGEPVDFANAPKFEWSETSVETRVSGVKPDLARRIEKPVPSKAPLTPEERAAADEMRGMLTLRRQAPERTIEPEVVTGPLEIKFEGLKQEPPELQLAKDVTPNVRSPEEVLATLRRDRARVSKASTRREYDTEIAKLEQQVAQQKALVPAPPRFEPTQAGSQGVLAETPQRTVPTAGLKPKTGQVEGLTDLEKANLPETQVDMFGPKPQGGDRFTPTKNPALDAELKKFPRGGAPVEDAFLTNIRSEDIRMLPTNVQKAVLLDSPVRVNFAEPGKLAQVKFQLERWASVNDIPISMPLEFIYRGSEAGEYLLSQMNNHASKINAFHHYFLDTLSKVLEIIPESSERQVVGKLLDWDGARWVAEQMGILNPTATPIPQPSLTRAASIARVFQSLSPEQRVLYSGLRQWLDEAGRTVGFEPGLSFTDYLSRFRESLEITRTIQIKIGEGEVSKTLTEMMPPKLKAYFEKPRTTDQPADLPLEETLKIYSAALARRIATSGGLDPRAPDVPVEGFLNRINPALANIPQPLQPFTKVLLEHYLGLGKGASEKSVGTELIRLIQFNRNMGLNMFSPPLNHTQKANTLAEVGPIAFVQGWRDMYDPQRVAIAKATGADIDIGPILQELGQVKAEGLLGKILEKGQAITKVTGYLFRQSERHNQLHGFLSGLRRAEQVFGEITPEAISYARDIQAGTQFGLPSSKVLTWEQNGIMGAWGQFKRFQVNQLLYLTRIVNRDIADWRRGNYGAVTRTLGYLTVVTALVGADGIFPGLDDKIKKNIFEKWPGGLAGLMGIYLADRVGLGAEDSRDIMRSVLFFMPGPMANNLIDAWSGARGVDFWTGREMGAAERSSKLTRSIPLSGIVIDRLRRAWVESQGPLQPNTMGEGFGIYKPTGARGEARGPKDIAMMAVGLPSARIHEELERKRGRADVRLEAMRAVREASDKFISGEIASSRNEYNRAVELKSDAMRIITDFNKENPGANLRLQGRNLREARERRRFTPIQRQKRAFPRSLRGVEEMREPPVFQPGVIQ